MRSATYAMHFVRPCDTLPCGAHLVRWCSSYFITHIGPFDPSIDLPVERLLIIVFRFSDICTAICSLLILTSPPLPIARTLGIYARHCACE
jgi:hypothetical protein